MWCIAVALVVLGVGCKRKQVSPEDQVRRTLAQLKAAVEQKDLGAARALLSESYRDAEQNDRGAAMALLQMQFMRRPSIHLFTRESALEVPTPGRAQVTLYVAMASLPIGAAADLAQINADIYRFDITVVLDGDAPHGWRIAGARWSPARPADLL